MRKKEGGGEIKISDSMMGDDDDASLLPKCHSAEALIRGEGENETSHEPGDEAT